VKNKNAKSIAAGKRVQQVWCQTKMSGSTDDSLITMLVVPVDDSETLPPDSMASLIRVVSARRNIVIQGCVFVSV
jgi:hypothetical protein